MITRSKAYKLRELIERASASLTDEEALDGVELFPHWVEDNAYAIGDRVYYDGTLYKCVQDHTSRSDWLPPTAISLWATVLIPDPDELPEWEQPISTNAYMMGDKVKHNGKKWISTIDYNVYEPGVAGWNEI